MTGKFPALPAWQHAQGIRLSVALQAPGKARHGRRERREVWALADPELNGYLGSAGSVGKPWPHVQQVCRVRRTRWVKGKIEDKVTYYVTSVSASRADAARLLGWTREYWGIENRLHHLRDVTLGEDASQVRTGAAPVVCAALRNLVLTLLRRAGATNMAAALRTHSARPRDAVALTLGRPPASG